MGGIAVRASDGEAVQYNGTTKESFVNEVNESSKTGGGKPVLP